MGLFSKKKTPTTSSQQYAPPPGPPPPQGGYHQQPPQKQTSNSYYQQSPQGQFPQQQQQQQYYGAAQGSIPANSNNPYYPQSISGHPQGQAVPGLQPHAAVNSTTTRGKEDPLAALAKYDTWFLIDDSESMEMHWDQVSSALATVIQTSVQYDADGVDISFFNNRTKATSKSSTELIQLFRRVEPRKSTPTASALNRVLDPYMSDLENWNVEGKPAGYPRPKPLNLIVLTDGAPDRGEDPEQVIVDIANRLDKGRFPPFQIGIQFVQIGVDEEASEHLRALDDDLKSKYKIRDYVDTTLFDVNHGMIDSNYILKALLGGLNRSIDNRS